MGNAQSSFDDYKFEVITCPLCYENNDGEDSECTFINPSHVGFSGVTSDECAHDICSNCWIDFYEKGGKSSEEDDIDYYYCPVCRADITDWIYEEISGHWVF